MTDSPTPMSTIPSSPVGLHRVLDAGPGVLPYRARSLDTRHEIWPDEVRVDVDGLSLHGPFYRQLRMANTDEAGALDVPALRGAVLDIVATHGKLQSPISGDGGKFTGTVAEVGSQSPLGLSVGDDIISVTSLAVTPLTLTDGLAQWDGLSEFIPTTGATAILFARSDVARRPTDLDLRFAVQVMRTSEAPAIVAQLIAEAVETGATPVVCVLGAEKTSGSLTLALAGQSAKRIAVTQDAGAADALRAAGLADEVIVADQAPSMDLLTRVIHAGGPAQITVDCDDTGTATQSAILVTEQGGTVVYAPADTDFQAAARGAEALAANVRMIIGAGNTPGHADAAIEAVRADDALRALLERRFAVEAPKHYEFDDSGAPWS